MRIRKSRRRSREYRVRHAGRRYRRNPPEQHIAEDEGIFVHQGAVCVTLAGKEYDAGTGRLSSSRMETGFEQCLRAISSRPGEKFTMPPPDKMQAVRAGCHEVMKCGITVNRWAHGYAFYPNPLFDPEWKEGEQPWVVGRKPFGRITIANSDSGAEAETNCAIDQAYRAVNEIASG